MSLTKRLIFGQGCVYICKRDAQGRKTQCSDTQDVSALTISPSETTVEHMEHCSGKQQVDSSVNFRPTVTGNIVFDSLDDEWLAFFYKGTRSTIASGTVTGEAHVLGADKILFTNQTNITTNKANITLAATAPAAAVIPAEDYTVSHTGKIQIVQSNVATAVTVGYAYGAATQVAAYTGNANEEYWLVYEGINLADQERPVIVDIYKCKFSQDGSQELISEDYITLGMGFQILFDDKQPNDPTTGRFLRQRFYNPV
jgi:hypothetical protein